MNEEVGAEAWEEVLVELARGAAAAVAVGVLVAEDDVEGQVVGTEVIEASAVAAECSPEDNGGFEDTDGESSPRCFSAAGASSLLEGVPKP